MLTEVDVRRRRLGGAVAAVVGVTLIVLAILALTGRLGAVDASRSGSEVAASASAAASGSTAPAAKVPLTVLNGGGPTGLASKGKAAFEEAGIDADPAAPAS